MYIRVHSLLLLFFIITPFLLNAQHTNLTNDEDFFNNQMVVYQQWLDKSGIGEVLSVRELKVEEDRLTLYLEFPTTDIDTIYSYWDSLKAKADAESPITLEEQLFYKMTSIMDIPPEEGAVAVYDNYNMEEHAFFLRGMYFENGEFKTETNDYKDSPRREVHFTPSKLGMKDKEVSVDFIEENYSKEKVYDKIYSFSKKHFEQKKCEQRYPKVRLLEKDENLHIEVIDLCREVLTDAANPLLAQALNWMGGNYNWVKREKLNILITYEKEEEGFTLYINIDGRYGSGMYSSVGRSGYYSMEVNFDEYLQDYADQFKEKIRQHIIHGK